MICAACLRRLSRGGNASSHLSRSLPPQQRSLSYFPARKSQVVTAQTTTATNPRPHGLPAATSTSAAQPFSTPLTSALTAGPPKKEAAPRVPSSVPAGTVLRGLNFMKTQHDPVAMEDDAYPAWLWEVLNEKKTEGLGGAGEKEGDLFSKSKKQRRLAAKALRKQQLLNPESLAPKVPIYEQSIDLPQGDGTAHGAKHAGQARQELTRAMRDKRRSTIKEANFLKEMR